MAEAQARAEAQPFEFHVPMDMETDAPATDAEETGSDAATDDGAIPEQAEAQHIEAEEPDPNDPESLRKKYNAQYSRKLEADRKRIREELLAELRTQQPEPAEARAEATPEAQGDVFDDVYKIDLDSFQPTLEFREGSDLADYKDELREVIGQGIKQGLKHALEGIKANDHKLREQLTLSERVSKAKGVIEVYAREIADHPEYAERAADLAKFAQKTQQLAIDDPELWVEMTEKKFGLDRNWRGSKQAEQEQAGAQNRRLANKPGAVVQRPTRASSSGGAADGNLKWDDALSAAIRKLR